MAVLIFRLRILNLFVLNVPFNMCQNWKLTQILFERRKLGVEMKEKGEGEGRRTHVKYFSIQI